MSDHVHEGGSRGAAAVGPGAEWCARWATGGLAGATVGAVGHADVLQSAAIAVVGGRTVAVTGADDDIALVWDLATGARIGGPLPGHGSVWAVAVTGATRGRPVVVIADASARVQSWDLSDGRPVAALAGGAWAAATAVVRGRPVVLVGRQSAPRLLLWDPVRGEVVAELASDGSSGRVGAVVAVATAVVGDRPYGITLHDDSAVLAWDLAARRYDGQIAPRTGGDDQRISLTTTVVDGRPVAVTGSWDGQVRSWDVVARSELPERATPPAHHGPVWSLASAVVDDHPLVVTAGDDRTVRVWNMAAQHQVGPDLRFPSEVTAVAMAPDGRLMVGVGGDVVVLAPTAGGAAAPSP
ncbi:WD40 repeat domain-containing protein [Streptomyces sp. NPDC003327]